MSAALLTPEMRRQILKVKHELEEHELRLSGHLDILNNIHDALEIARYSAGCLLTSDPFATSCIDELEEQITAAGNDWQVADFVDDKQREAAKEPDLLAQCALALGFGERADEITEGCEVDATASLDGLHAERQRQMALPCSGRAQEV